MKILPEIEHSGIGSGSPEKGEDTLATTQLYDQQRNFTFGNIFDDVTSSNGSYSGDIRVHRKSKYALYVGGGLSILSCLIALFTYTSSRKVCVNRPHMITINLCISLLIFYIGIIMSASISSHVVQPFNDDYGACVAAATFFHVGVLYSWTWMTLHWTYLTYTVHRAAAYHISHFAIKISLPAYGIPSLLTGALLIANATTDTGYYISRKTCLFDWEVPLNAAINFLYISLCFIIIASCATYCISRLTCKRDQNRVESTRMRIKVSVTRLAVITTGVMIISILEIIRSGVGESSRHTGGRFEIFNGIVLGVAGILVSIGLTLRSKEFRLYMSKRNPSTATLRRVLSNLRNKNTVSSGESDENGNRFRPNESKNPTPVLYDEIRPPKLVPRENAYRHSRPQLKVGPLVTFLSSTLKSRESNDPTTSKEDNRDDVFIEEVKPVDNAVEPQRRSVPKFGSLRQRAMKIRNGTQPRTQSVRTSAPTRPPVRPARRTHVIPEDRASISSLDIYRKSSF